MRSYKLRITLQELMSVAYNTKEFSPSLKFEAMFGVDCVYVVILLNKNKL